MDQIETESGGFGSFVMPTTASEMLASMARLYKYDLSEFESMLWEAQIFSQFPDQIVMRALLDHMELPSADAKFMPKYGAIKAKLEPVRGFGEIERAVRTGSPYVMPDLKDPVLVEAVHQMGGWTLVCAEMPDPRERPIDFDRYLRRFESALGFARNQVNVQGKLPAPLAAIGIANTSRSTANPALGVSAKTLALEAPAGSTNHLELPAPKNAQDLSVATRKILRTPAAL